MYLAIRPSSILSKMFSISAVLFIVSGAEGEGDWSVVKLFRILAKVLSTMGWKNIMVMKRTTIKHITVLKCPHRFPYDIIRIYVLMIT